VHFTLFREKGQQRYYGQVHGITQAQKLPDFGIAQTGTSGYGLARIFRKNSVLVHMRLSERNLRSDRFRHGALPLAQG